MDVQELFDYCQGKNRIYIYGAGVFGKRLALFLRQKDIQIRGFIETKKTKEYFRDIPVCGVDSIESLKPDGILVCVSDKYANEIAAELNKRGHEEYISVCDKSIHEYIDSQVLCDCHSKVYSGFVQVLMFHRVVALPNNSWGMAVHPELFEGYMRHIAENYQVLRFEDDWSTVWEKAIVVTLDDGYVDNYQYALPIFEKYQIPATIFVSTGNIDSKREFWWDTLTRLLAPEKLRSVRDRLKFMTRKEREKVISKFLNAYSSDAITERDRALNCDELKYLSESPFITIGGHTVSHGALAGEEPDLQKWELLRSKQRIEEIINKPVEVFSYPFGQDDTYNETTVTLLKSVGYKKAATTHVGLFISDTDLYHIPRNAQPPRSVEDFSKALEECWYMYDER